MYRVDLMFILFQYATYFKKVKKVCKPSEYDSIIEHFHRLNSFLMKEISISNITNEQIYEKHLDLSFPPKHDDLICLINKMTITDSSFDFKDQFLKLDAALSPSQKDIKLFFNIKQFRKLILSDKPDIISLFFANKKATRLTDETTSSSSEEEEIDVLNWNQVKNNIHRLGLPFFNLPDFNKKN